MNQRQIWIGAVCLAGFTQLGCLQADEFNKPFVPTTPAVSAKPLAVEAAPVDDYTFVPTGKRDPFISRDLRRTRTTKDPNGKDKGPLVKATRRKARGPLQRYELDAYRLKAVISGISRPMAVVVDPLGRSYIVRRGMAIGQDGRIARILARGLVISSTRRTGHLTRRRSYRMMHFHKGGKGKSQPGVLKIEGKRLLLAPGGDIKRGIYKRD